MPQLFEDLQEGTYASGTLRTDKKHFPNFLKPQQRSLTEGYTFAYCKNTIVVRWNDVYTLSTLLSDATTQGEVVALQSASPVVKSFMTTIILWVVLT